MAETADHYHLTASKALKNGTTDRHRFTVAAECLDQEREISRDMGYEVKSELCYNDCLGQTLKS